MKLVQLGRVARLSYGGSLASEARREGPVPVFGSNGRVGSHDRANTLGPVIVVGRKGSQGAVRYSDQPVFAIDTTYFVDSSTTVADLRWLYYVLLDARLSRLSVDTGVPGLNRATAYAQSIPFVNDPDQRDVADFLDREVGRLDAVAAAKRRMIELLAEKRTALITHTVTKGLNPNAPMKETGIPWLGEIPAHWDVALLNKVAATGSGHTPSRSRPDWWVDCAIPWITTGEVDELRRDAIHILTATREYVSELGLANSSATVHPAGTVFLSRTASPGFAGIMGTDMATSQDFVTWTPGNRIDSHYLAVALRAMRADLLGRLTQGSTHRTIYMPDLMGLVVPLPPLEEQLVIAETVNYQLSTINSAADALQAQLTLVSEFKSALITAAVTGQLDEATLKGEKSLDDAMEELRENDAA